MDLLPKKSIVWVGNSDTAFTVQDYASQTFLQK